MAVRKTLLVVDDSPINRQILCKILSDSYDILQAENGEAALNLLAQESSRISAILLDIVMPIMNGYQFLETVQAIPKYSGIPIIVTTQHEGEDTEIAALSLGASDFLTTPYHPTIIRQRIANTIRFRETASVINAIERDPLTGLYNKDGFYRRACEILDENPQKPYGIISADVERFKLVNDLFGVDEGDKLLKYISKLLQLNIPAGGVCGRVSGDLFFALVPVESAGSEYCWLERMSSAIREYPLNISLSLKYGIYHIEDRTVPFNAMCDRAKLAADSVKDKYDVTFACYQESLREVLLSEQQIINDMKAALRDRQFVVYFQPLYDLDSEIIVSAEALVRWQHPIKGLIPPAQFIPLFEKNGFITDLDIYVWDNTCKFIREWIDCGNPAITIAVNVSRVDIYNPNLADILMGILNKYNLTPQHLNLEITETAYAESPTKIIKAVTALHNLGFTIEMDDFGTGYSSLNMLNELPIDTLKLDMRFLQDYSDKNRKGNILSFIISLAKWLGLSVIAEGVETQEQLIFLRSMGCNFGQGYYFSKPLPQESFKHFFIADTQLAKKAPPAFLDVVALNDIWDPLSSFNVLFNSEISALAICYCAGDDIAFIRGNSYFFKLLNIDNDGRALTIQNLFGYVHSQDRARFIAQINMIKTDYREAEITSRWYFSSSFLAYRWLRLRIKVLRGCSESAVVIVAVEDVTHRNQLNMQQALQYNTPAKSEKISSGDKQAMYGGSALFETTGNFDCIKAELNLIKLLGFFGAEDFFAAPRNLFDFVDERWQLKLRKELMYLLSLSDIDTFTMRYQLKTYDQCAINVESAFCLVEIEGRRIMQCIITALAQLEQAEGLELAGV